MHDIENPDEFWERVVEGVPGVQFEIGRQPGRRRALVETDVEAVWLRRWGEVGACVEEPDSLEKMSVWLDGGIGGMHPLPVATSAILALLGGTGMLGCMLNLRASFHR